MSWIEFLTVTDLLIKDFDYYLFSKQDFRLLKNSVQRVMMKYIAASPKGRCPDNSGNNV